MLIDVIEVKDLSLKGKRFLVEICYASLSGPLMIVAFCRLVLAFALVQGDAARACPRQQMDTLR